MLCERVLGRFSEQVGATAYDADRLDWLDLAWDECHRRALRAVTRRGRAVRLLLRLGTTLRHLDILSDDAECLLVVHVPPIETLVVRPRSLREAGLVAMEWGNLHIPIEVTDDAIITLPDGPAEAALVRLNLLGSSEFRRFEPMPVSGLAWTMAVGGGLSKPNSGNPVV